MVNGMDTKKNHELNIYVFFLSYIFNRYGYPAMLLKDLISSYDQDTEFKITYDIACVFKKYFNKVGKSILLNRFQKHPPVLIMQL